MAAPRIITLASAPGLESQPTLASEIEDRLVGGPRIVPGDRPEDQEFAYTRSVPTMVLYSERGLRLYDRITEQAPEYYLFQDELNLFKTHGAEIALAMGFPERQEEQRVPLKDDPSVSHGPRDIKWKAGRWGDEKVGKWNGGVNAEEGLGDGVERGWDVVELGAGALRKTAHLLQAISANVTLSSTSAPIKYHPLDLSHPELARTMVQMQETIGPELAGKVDCIGLHGDYFVGLKLIRQGGGIASLDTANHQVPKPVAFSVSPEPTKLFNPTTPLMTPPMSPTQSQVTPPSTAGDLSELTLDDVMEASFTSRSESPTTSAASTETDKPTRPLHIVFLGSSLGNFDRAPAAPFLSELPLRPNGSGSGAGDTLLLGLDGRPEPGFQGRRKVEQAYNDPKGCTRDFEEHGWEVLRDELGLKGDAGVEFVGRYNEVLGRHEAYFKSKADQTIHLPGKKTDVNLKEGELINIEWSYKYSMTEALKLFEDANLRVINSWKAPDSEYRLWLLERPAVTFPICRSPKLSTEVAPQFGKSIPARSEWESLWKFWDGITLGMIPETMLHQKPIDLRHKCLFYLGHIPAFLDIHLTRLLRGQHTEPEHFKDIFERGIDPHVDDPTQVHAHSAVPEVDEDWPSLQEILSFRDRVRQRLLDLYSDIENGSKPLSRRTGRVLWMTFEHEAFHAETLLYMLLQSSFVLPPKGFTKPSWNSLAQSWVKVAEAEKSRDSTLLIEAGQVQLGHNDSESEDGKFVDEAAWGDHEFGWDNENPLVTSKHRSFRVERKTITNKQYLEHYHQAGLAVAPASWVKKGQDFHVRTVYGPVSFDIAGDWPVMASKDEFDGFAKAQGGRLPTETELRALWEHSEGPRPAGLNANVGVKSWHPVPATLTKRDSDGNILYGHNGGVWEWTNTEFAGHEGFETSELYPGYSTDFFDGVHYVTMGGSFATIPRIAGRKSLRNFYQAAYRYAWIGGRVVYDV